MLGLYTNNRKAICSRGIQDSVGPEEINKKAEHNDKAPKNSYITLLSLWLCEILTHEMKSYICILRYSEDNGLSSHLFQISVDTTHD